PDKADSTAKGTKISPSQLAGLSSACGRIAYCHSPLRFVHSFRTICGRGYSDKTFSGETSLVQRVLSGPSAGSQPHAGFAATFIASNTKPHQKFRRFIASLRFTEPCGGHCILPECRFGARSATT